MDGLNDTIIFFPSVFWKTKPLFPCSPKRLKYPQKYFVLKFGTINGAKKKKKIIYTYLNFAHDGYFIYYRAVKYISIDLMPSLPGHWPQIRIEVLLKSIISHFTAVITVVILIRKHFNEISTTSKYNKKTLMQSINYAAKIVFIWVLFYWRSFEEQQAHGPHLLTWVNSYKRLIMQLSLLVVMFLPNYHFGCHSNQSNSAFWTKCVYSVEDYSSNISIKLLSTYLQWVRNKGLLSFIFSGQVCHLSPLHLYNLPGTALAVLPRH